MTENVDLEPASTTPAATHSTWLKRMSGVAVPLWLKRMSGVAVPLSTGLGILSQSVDIVLQNDAFSKLIGSDPSMVIGVVGIFGASAFFLLGGQAFTRYYVSPLLDYSDNQ